MQWLQHKTGFMKNVHFFFHQRKRAKMQWLQHKTGFMKNVHFFPSKEAG
jgi:hypothetical protein